MSQQHENTCVVMTGTYWGEYSLNFIKVELQTSLRRQNTSPTFLNTTTALIRRLETRLLLWAFESKSTVQPWCRKNVKSKLFLISFGTLADIAFYIPEAIQWRRLLFIQCRIFFSIIRLCDIWFLWIPYTDLHNSGFEAWGVQVGQRRNHIISVEVFLPLWEDHWGGRRN